MKNETRKEQKKDTKKPEVKTRAVEELWSCKVVKL